MLYHLADNKDDPFNVLAMKVIKVLKDLANDNSKRTDKIKKLEVDKKVKELEVYRKKLAEIDSKKAKEMEEKLSKIKENGFDFTNSESLVEKMIKENGIDYNQPFPTLDLINKDD